MAQFEITSPTGERFVITAPDGATEEQALEFAKSQGPKPKQPSPIQEKTGGYVDRSTFEAVGGTTGAIVGGGVGLAAGIPTGPGVIGTTTAGAIAGGSLGSAAGSLTYDAVNNLLLSMGIGSGEYTGIESTLEEAGTSGVTDLAFSGAAATLGPLGNLLRGGRPLMGRILGVANEGAAEIATRARQLGIDLGIVNLSERALVTGSPGVLGVMPIVGTPLRRLSKRQPGQLEEAGEELINEIAPVGLLTDLGLDLTRAAEATHDASRKKITAAWDVFRESAAKLSVPDVFPTKSVKEHAQELVDEAFKAKIPLEGQESIGGKVAGNAELASYVEKLKDLPEYLTIEQVRGISKELNRFADAAMSTQSREDMALIGQLKRLVQADIQNIDVSRLSIPEAQEIVTLLGVANRLTATELKQFETATAKKLGTFDKNIFGVGPFQAGAKEADQLAKTLVKLDSPTAIQNLRTVVGDDVMNRLARQRVQDAWDEAHTIVGKDSTERIFNPFAFEKLLGLEAKGSKDLNRQTLDALLKTTGTSVKQFEEFLEVAKKAYTTEVADASKFVARRFIMTAGGAGAAAGAAATAGAFAGAAGAGGVSIGTVALAAMARYGASYIAKPDKLRLLTRVLDDTVPDKLRRQTLVRLLRLSAEEE